MTIKKRTKGEIYRPVAKVLKTKKDVPTVLQIGNRRYVLDHGNK
ncbi:hypothetical protein [Planomicrobium sp. CPCC 101079]|nr:hypothetical protein [Planomicrobium sp. CPCC 101079]